MNASPHMEHALEVAKAALDRGELPIAAVVVLDDRVVAEAHTLERESRRYLVHAELLALLAFDQQNHPIGVRRRSALLTTLEPCMMCLGAALSAFIGTLVYAMPAPADGACHLLGGYPRGAGHLLGGQALEVTSGPGRAASRALFEAYLRQAKPGPLRDFARSILQG